MVGIPTDQSDAQALLKKAESFLKKKKAFEDTNKYQEAWKKVEEVKKVVDPTTGERFMHKDPASAIVRLREAIEILGKLG